MCPAPPAAGDAGLKGQAWLGTWFIHQSPVHERAFSPVRARHRTRGLFFSYEIQHQRLLLPLGTAGTRGRALYLCAAARLLESLPLSLPDRFCWCLPSCPCQVTPCTLPTLHFPTQHCDLPARFSLFSPRTFTPVGTWDPLRSTLSPAVTPSPSLCFPTPLVGTRGCTALSLLCQGDQGSTGTVGWGCPAQGTRTHINMCPCLPCHAPPESPFRIHQQVHVRQDRASSWHLRSSSRGRWDSGQGRSHGSSPAPWHRGAQRPCCTTRETGP